jgi:hypothetical protein
MAIYSKKPTGSEFFVFHTFGSYTVYDSTFGLVVAGKSGQLMYQRSRVILNAFVTEQLKKNKTSKFHMLEMNASTGFSEVKFTHPYYDDKRARSSPSSIASNVANNRYELLLKVPSIFYCIKNLANEYYLYDFDLGNPLSGEVDIGVKSMMKTSKKSSDTIELIDSLPDTALVYSLEVSDSGLVKGHSDYAKSAKGIQNHTKLENLTVQKANNLSTWNASKKALLEKKKSDLMHKRGAGNLL